MQKLFVIGIGFVFLINCTNQKVKNTEGVVPSKI
jgi:hypothetical protein